MSTVEINKYQRGKIYKLLNAINDEVYVGSTCQKYLSKRMGKHKEDALIKHSPIYKLMNEIGFDKFYIELIENFPCNSKDELTARENEWIRKIGTLNIRIEGRTKKEYYEENKIVLAQQKKIYLEENKEVVADRKHTYYIKNKDKISIQGKEKYKNDRDTILERNKTYREANLNTIAEKAKKHYEDNKDIIKVWKSTKIHCVCGGSYTNCHKAAHLKCIRHRTYEESSK